MRLLEEVRHVEVVVVAAVVEHDPALLTLGLVVLRHRDRGGLSGFSGGARGVLTVSQVSAGRKNRLYYEIDGAAASLAWDSERPNELWIGHRERANEVLIKTHHYSTRWRASSRAGRPR